MLPEENWKLATVVDMGKTARAMMIAAPPETVWIGVWDPIAQLPDLLQEFSVGDVCR